MAEIREKKISNEEVLRVIKDAILLSVPESSRIIHAIGEGVRLAIKESIEDGSLKIKIDK